MLLAAVAAAAWVAGGISCAPRGGDGAGGAAQNPAGALPFRSPEAMAFSPDGRLLAVCDRTAWRLVMIDPAARRVVREVVLRGDPAAMAWSADGRSAYVAESGAGSVAEVDAATGRVVRRLRVGRYPSCLAVAHKRRLLLVGEDGQESLGVVDLASGAVKRRIVLPGSTRALAVHDGDDIAVVGCFAPTGDATVLERGAVVSVIDLATAARASDVELPSDSTNVRSVAVAADGRWAFVAHVRGQSQQATTHLDDGWVNRNMVSVIDLRARRLHTALLLDTSRRGAADPWTVALSRDGRRLWVTLAGAGELAELDWETLLKLLEGKGRPEDVQRTVIWQIAGMDADQRLLLANDFGALESMNLLKRHGLGVEGPRGLAISPDASAPASGARMAVGGYFSGDVLLLDGQWVHTLATLRLGRQPPATPQRRGERVFHDGRLAYQGWLSCSTCHPAGRADGLNWDLLNDGMGNPKNTRSLLLADRTPPMMSLRVRADLPGAVKAGFEHILYADANASQLADVEAYVRSLAPAASPYRAADGGLTAEANRGRAIFESDRTGCASCHPAPLYTDCRGYDVGVEDVYESGKKFDTPTLMELWRTGPYLHNGTAPTLRDVLVKFNEGDRHGRTSHLSSQQIDDLVAYLLSL